MSIAYLITGAQSQIAISIVKSLKVLDLKVILTDLDDKNNLGVIRGDLTSQNFINCLFDELEKSGDEIRLIHLAGITLPNKGLYPIDKWQKTFEVNANATFLLLREYHRRVLDHKILKGSIVLISSAISSKTLSDNPAYPASKLVVESLTKHYSRQLADFNVSVNCILPGYIMSNMTKESFENKNLREERNKLSYLKRWGSPEEVSELAIFLSKRSNSFLTGGLYTIDGGWNSNAGI